LYPTNDVPHTNLLIRFVTNVESDEQEKMLKQTSDITFILFRDMSTHAVNLCSRKALDFMLTDTEKNY